MINPIVKKYQYGTFDGMTDCYNNDNISDNLPQAKYVSTSRSASAASVMACMPKAEEIYNQNSYSCHNASNLRHQIFIHFELKACGEI